MQGLNKVMLIGNLGKNPEYKELEHGLTLAKIALATSESYRDQKGESHTQTEWHTVLLWRSLADYAHKYLKKGNLVYIEGKIKTRTFEDKDNIKRYVTEIVADTLHNLEKNKGGTKETTPNQPTTDALISDIEKDQNLPF